MKAKLVGGPADGREIDIEGGIHVLVPVGFQRAAHYGLIASIGTLADPDLYIYEFTELVETR